LIGGLGFAAVKGIPQLHTVK